MKEIASGYKDTRIACYKKFTQISLQQHIK